MDTPKFTPGPWKVGNRFLDLVEIASPHGFPICSVPFKWRIEEQNSHNAHLIAAAPDLFEALKECREWYETKGFEILGNLPDKPTPICFNKALTALRLAQGK